MSDLECSGMDALIQELGDIPRKAKEALPDVGRAVIEDCRRNIAAQSGPDGEAWTPGRSGQGKVLTGAGKALTMAVSGNVLVINLDGVEARHHLGAIKGAGSISLGPGGKRRDRGHKAGERARIIAAEGTGAVVGAKMSAYARPILPGPDSPALARAWKGAISMRLNGSIWGGR